MNGLVYLMYNSSVEIAICWDKLILGLSTPARLVNIDNASTDNSVDILERAGYVIETNEENTGFTAGINQGIRNLLDKGVDGWIFIINPDVICQENWDKLLIEAPLTYFPDSDKVSMSNFSTRAGVLGENLENEGQSFVAATEPLCKNKKCGIVGAKLVSASGNIIHSGGQIVAEKSLLKWPIAYSVGGGKNVVVEEALCVTRFMPEAKEFSEPKMSPWVTFSVVALRADMVRDIGLLDESYFLYGSDMDYCVRAWDRGWEVWSSPAVFTHLRHDTIQRAPRQVQRKAKQDMALFTSKEEMLWQQLQVDLLPWKIQPSSQ